MTIPNYHDSFNHFRTHSIYFKKGSIQDKYYDWCEKCDRYLGIVENEFRNENDELFVHKSIDCSLSECKLLERRNMEMNETGNRNIELEVDGYKVDISKNQLSYFNSIALQLQQENSHYVELHFNSGLKFMLEFDKPNIILIKFYNYYFKYDCYHEELIGCMTV